MYEIKVSQACVSKSVIQTSLLFCYGAVITTFEHIATAHTQTENIGFRF